MSDRQFNWYADLGNGNYRNPILYTDYSDPDAIRVGDDFYMISSSFCNTPGLPILHSKDLVNWKVINYALKNIPFERYVKPQHGCGVWAPAIRYHNGEFIIFFPMPDEGIFVTKTKDPYGEWSKPHAIFEGKGWIDPCPFWDEDGRAYMVSAYAKSRIGFKSILHMNEMTPDCMQLIGNGQDVFDGNVNDQETIEGPKLYKRNGYYYIFAPAGGVKPGWQAVLRSKNIWGPYEAKNVLVQGDTPVNGPHQGAWVDTQAGEDYFLHFQDVYAAGRIVHLQPMIWENDWPIIGERINDDAGQPVMIHKKPDIGEAAQQRLNDSVENKHINNENAAFHNEIFAPDASDNFDSDTLGLQWQWNANHDDSWYSLGAGKAENAHIDDNNEINDWLTLKAVEKKETTSIADVPNLLLQKWIAPEFIADTVVDLSEMKKGDITGMISMGVTYGALNIRCTNDGETPEFELESIIGRQTFNNSAAFSSDIIKTLDNFTIKVLYLRNRIVKINSKVAGVPREMIYLEYSFNGNDYHEALSFESEAGRWVGVKNGMYCCHEGAGKAGKASFAYFNIHE